MLVYLFYAMTAAWIIGGAVALRKMLCIKKHGENVAAHITAHETSDNTTYTPIVSYTYGGKYHETRCGKPSKTKHPLHEAVTVIVAPEYPDSPIMPNESLAPLPIFCFAVGGVCLAMSIYMSV
ncbi:MAG: hypothetical protein EOM30_12595 [Clostridia bacterium]|jgi:hypothetical protein|nr:hypothetical protein [Clostridia bacterium]NLS86279.1 hypothetical protein [Oscillospiraceae bacterium]